MWEIYAYQNSESLFGIFNAVAGIMGAASFTGTLAIAAVVGFFAALLAYAFAPQKLHGWYWLGSVVLVTTLLVGPRATVGIVDKTGSGPVRVVANVPFGLAVFGSLTSTVGNSLTELFETAFQALPGPGQLDANLTYQQHGILFGNRLIRSAGTVSIPDPIVRTDLVNFVVNCTIFDLNDGAISPTRFNTSDNVWGLMQDTNPARFTTIAATGGGTDVVTCPAAYSNLDSRLPQQVALIEEHFGLQMNPTLPGTAVASIFAGQIESAYTKNAIATAGASAGDIIRQHALLRTFSDAAKLGNQRVNDPTAMLMSLANAQAIDQQNNIWMNSARIAEQALPILRNVIEALIYALFPIAIAMMLMTGGRETAIALKSYVVVLLWIQLWPMLYAILNYMATIYAQFDLAAAADVGGGTKALSILTAGRIHSSAIKGEAVVGNLLYVIPFISWAALKRMETFGTAVASGWTGLGGTISAASSSAALGNVSMGVQSMDQYALAPSMSNASVSRFQSTRGDWVTRDAQGREAVEILSNRGFVAVQSVQRAAEQQAASAQRQVEVSEQSLTSATSTLAASASEVYSRIDSRVRSSGTRSSTGNSVASEVSDSQADVGRIVRNVAKELGTSEKESAQLLFSGALRGSAGLGLGKGGSAFSASGQLAGAGALSKSFDESLTGTQRRALQSLSSSDWSKLRSYATRSTTDAAYFSSATADAREASELAARLNRERQIVEQSASAYASRQSQAEQALATWERAKSISFDTLSAPENSSLLLEVSNDVARGNYARATAALESQLAATALPPTLASGGRVLSAQQLREEYERRSDVLVEATTSDIEMQRVIREAEVRNAAREASLRSRNGAGVGPAASVGPTNTLREDGDRERNAIDQQYDRFFDDAGVRPVARDGKLEIAPSTSQTARVVEKGSARVGETVGEARSFLERGVRRLRGLFGGRD